MDGNGKDKRSLHIGIPNDDLREFARNQAANFFGGVVSAYVVSLIEADRREGWTQKDALKRVTAVMTSTNGVQAA